MRRRLNFPGLVIVTGVALYIAHSSGPIMIANHIQTWPVIAYSIAFLAVLRTAIETLYLLATLFDWWGSHKATGRSGTARWGRYRDLKSELVKGKQGPFWGIAKEGPSKPLLIDYVSNAMTVAPAGSGKGTGTVVPNILSIRASKCVPDFKGELTCICKDALKRRGEHVVILNPFGLWEERLGETDHFNPVDIIVHSLHRPGALRDIYDDLRELGMQLLKEPDGGKSDDTYWRDGARGIISFCTLLEAMIEGYDATLSSVATLIEDRQALEDNLRFVIGVDMEGKALPEGPMPIETAAWAVKHDAQEVAEFAKLFRARAGNLLSLMSGSESKTFDSFLTAAQQSLAPFAFGRLSRAMGKSTFSMNVLKEGDNATTLFIIADASRPETSGSYLGLMQWCFLTAMKRHKDKHIPVYNILDEATNYKIHGLLDLLTFGRGYGIRNHLIFQDFTAFERRYGRDAIETLLSETEVKQFLPSQRSPKTLEMIAKLLGEQSFMVAGLSGGERERGLREHMSESARNLMTIDEIRRSEHALLFVRRKPPVMTKPITYAEIHPWRRQAGINPFHGKAFIKKVKLRI